MLTEDALNLDDPTPVIQELWRNDTGAFPIDRAREGLDQLGKSAPSDDRLWLAQANLATRAGRLDDAGRWLARCEARRPDDPAVGRARLDLAIARDDSQAVIAALGRLREADLSPAESLRVRAWFASKRGDARAQCAALEALVAVDPGRSPAVERLAELASQAGDRDEAARCRGRKAELDRAREPYRQGMAKDAKDHAEQLAGLAETLGRLDEARAWWRVARDRNRQAPDARAVLALARLDPARSPRPARRRLAGRPSGRRPRRQPRDSVLVRPARRRPGHSARVRRRRGTRRAPLRLPERQDPRPPAPRDHGRRCRPARLRRRRLPRPLPHPGRDLPPRSRRQVPDGGRRRSTLPQQGRRHVRGCDRARRDRQLPTRLRPRRDGGRLRQRRPP